MYRIWLLLSATLLAAVLALADDGRPATGHPLQPPSATPATPATPVGR